MKNYFTFIFLKGNMSGIQTILTLGAFILLMLVIVGVNSRITSTDDVMYDSNFGITATSIASSIIEDASRLKFDSVTDTLALDPSKDGNLLTDPNSLGRESGEIKDDPGTWNDFDDYNDYEGVDSTMPTAIFNFKCEVHYVDPDAPDVPVNSKTFSKKISVKVWSKSMKDTIYQSSVFSYWYFE